MNTIEKTIKITTGKSWKQSREVAIENITQALQTAQRRPKCREQISHRIKNAGSNVN